MDDLRFGWEYVVLFALAFVFLGFKFQGRARRMFARREGETEQPLVAFDESFNAGFPPSRNAASARVPAFGSWRDNGRPGE